MSEIRFYHLLRQTPEQALPALLQKALGTGKNIVICAPDRKRIESINDALWTYEGASFLPHGTDKEGHQDQQPIFITDKTDDRPNDAGIFIAACGAALPDDMSCYSLVCYMFDGRYDDMVTDARHVWKALKDQDHDLTYWQQTDRGWEKKA